MRDGVSSIVHEAHEQTRIRASRGSVRFCAFRRFLLRVASTRSFDQVPRVSLLIKTTVPMVYLSVSKPIAAATQKKKKKATASSQSRSSSERGG